MPLPVVLLLLLILAIRGVAPAGAAEAPQNPALENAALTTSVLARPFPGPARSIGSAANGCLAGAVALPLTGPGWQVMRPERNRFWGNPALVAFIEDMAAHTRSSLGTLMVADMAQPRGGQMLFGHGSHETGVDVDIFYRLLDRPLADEERGSVAMESVLSADGRPDPAKWGDSQVGLLKVFASDRRVERIFVNPMIKRALCAAAGDEREWLRKVRPWWGHADHFHVRIKCPPGDHECVGGPPLPPGDGCGAELTSWITSGDWNARPHPSAHPRPIYRTTMPRACKLILGQG